MMLWRPCHGCVSNARRSAGKRCCNWLDPMPDRRPSLPHWGSPLPPPHGQPRGTCRQKRGHAKTVTSFNDIKRLEPKTRLKLGGKIRQGRNFLPLGNQAGFVN